MRSKADIAKQVEKAAAKVKAGRLAAAEPASGTEAKGATLGDPAESPPESTSELTSTPRQVIGEHGRKSARDRQRKELLLDKQLTLWADALRGAPNEIVRSALFTARNRKQPRENLKRAVVAVIGEGEINYTGEELRQDDETVWLQLIHLARENGLATPFEFTPFSFCKSIDWPVTGQSYDRLEKCMTRLQATSLKIFSRRLGDGISLSMLPGFKSKRRKDGDGGLWEVRMHDELVFLFSEFQYTRVEWRQRLALPEGLATWLHAYFASSKEPYDVKIETLAVGAGLMAEVAEDAQLDDATRKERLREVKKKVVMALEALKKAGFLVDYEVGRTGLVKVRRAGDSRPIF